MAKECKPQQNDFLFKQNENEILQFYSLSRIQLQQETKPKSQKLSKVYLNTQTTQFFKIKKEAIIIFVQFRVQIKQANIFLQLSLIVFKLQQNQLKHLSIYRLSLSQFFQKKYNIILFTYNKMMHPGPKSKPNASRQQDKQEPSKVLLVCIYDTVAFEVTNQLIYQNFSKFGNIIKVLIFEKGEVTKLFVQYTQTKFAQQAKNTLDGTKLLGAICKMSIYYSNFSNVDLKNQTSQGSDYTMQQEIKNQYVRRFDQISQSFQSEENHILDDEFIMQSAFNQFGPRSKTDNPQRLQEQVLKLKVTPVYQNQPHIHPMIKQEDELQHYISHGINNIIQTHSSHSYDPRYQKTNPEAQSNAQRIHPSLRLRQKEPTKSPVLKFNLTKDVSLRCIYNLFSNFGNISFITKKNKTAYIKFRTIQFAAIARTYLNQKSLMGNLLLLQYPESGEEASPKQAEYCQCTFYDETFDRFTPHRSLTVNSPSQTLHVSSLKKDTCKQHILYNIFSEFGKIEAVRILCYSNEKNMALVKFYSIEDSFEAISCLHNQIFSGRKMQISFTKSKI